MANPPMAEIKYRSRGPEVLLDLSVLNIHYFAYNVNLSTMREVEGP